VAKPGRYKAVAYTEYKDEMLGRSMTFDLQPVK
jgi:hypothetical protein